MNNSSNTSDICPETIENHTSFILKLLVFTLIGGCGFFGNVFIIVLAVKYTVTRNLHHLIINMAVADTIVVITTFALEIPVLVDEKAWTYVQTYTGNVLCKILAFFLGLGMMQTSVSLFMISIERFRATKLTVHRSQSYSLKQRAAMLAGCWLFAIGLASHELHQSTITHEDNAYYCHYLDTSSLAWNVTLIIIPSPVIVAIFVLSILTLRRLSSLHTNPVNLPEAQRKARKKRMTNSIKLVLSSLALYMGCYLPRYVANALKVVDWTNVCIDYNLYDYVLTCLVIANSCFSPCIYLIFMADFRKAARKLFCRRTKPLEMRRNSTHDHQPEEDIGESQAAKTTIELKGK